MYWLLIDSWYMPAMPCHAHARRWRVRHATFLRSAAAIFTPLLCQRHGARAKKAERRGNNCFRWRCHAKRCHALPSFSLSRHYQPRHAPSMLFTITLFLWLRYAVITPVIIIIIGWCRLFWVLMRDAEMDWEDYYFSFWAAFPSPSRRHVTDFSPFPPVIEIDGRMIMIIGFIDDDDWIAAIFPAASAIYARAAATPLLFAQLFASERRCITHAALCRLLFSCAIITRHDIFMIFIAASRRHFYFYISSCCCIILYLLLWCAPPPRHATPATVITLIYRHYLRHYWCHAVDYWF